MKTIKLLVTATAILFAGTSVSSAHGVTVKTYPFQGIQMQSAFNQANYYVANPYNRKAFGPMHVEPQVVWTNKWLFKGYVVVSKNL